MHHLCEYVIVELAPLPDLLCRGGADLGALNISLEWLSYVMRCS